MTRLHFPRILGAASALAVAGTWATLSGRPMGTPDEAGAFGFRAGERVEDFRFKDIEGEKGRLSGLLEDHEAVVVAVRNVGCPVSQKYGHELARLEKEYGARGVAFLYLNVSPQDDVAEMREEIERFAFTSPYIADPDARIGTLLQTKVTTEVFIIDAARTLRYRGAIDDQYGITFHKPEAREHWLRNALDAVLIDQGVAVDETDASGCFLELPASSQRVPLHEITYHNRVSRIIRDNCETCHRTGGIAPFALASYEDVSGFRGMIRYAVQEQRMPPWFANPAHGEWRNDRRLSERDRRDLLAWIDAGAPEGDKAAGAGDRSWVDGWQLTDEPDAVVAIPEPHDVPAEGVVEYQYKYVQTHFGEDKWITAIESRPTAPAVTHHIIVFLVDGPDDEEGEWLGGTAPGVPPQVYPQGSGKKLPKDAWLMFELHYTPNGTAATDQSRVALEFADSRPDRVVETSFVATTEFEIPAGAPNHEIVADLTFEESGTLINLLPHMHLRGKAFRYELIHADGTKNVVLDVPRYDFNWQLIYEFAEPLHVEKGDVLRGRAWYDNSANNPANPDPGKVVTFGQQSFEEMMFGFFDWIPDRASPPTVTETGG
ncbi:MAG: redoxin domain-containing protein [Longimicrobiales bacterium]